MLGRTAWAGVVTHMVERGDPAMLMQRAVVS